MSRPAEYSRLQKVLHWTVAAMLAVNYFVGDGMGHFLRAKLDGESVEALGPLVHTLVGWAVLLLVLARLFLRATRAAPPAPEGGALLRLGATVVHAALYVALLALPISGMAAWYLGVHEAGDAHETIVNVIIALAAVHVAGALFHQFIRRDGLIRRMT